MLMKFFTLNESNIRNLNVHEFVKKMEKQFIVLPEIIAYFHYLIEEYIEGFNLLINSSSSITKVFFLKNKIFKGICF